MEKQLLHQWCGNCIWSLTNYSENFWRSLAMGKAKETSTFSIIHEGAVFVVIQHMRLVMYRI